MKYIFKIIVQILVIFQTNTIIAQSVSLDFDESVFINLSESIFNDVKNSIVIVSVKDGENANTEAQTSIELGVGVIYNKDGIVIINRYALRNHTSNLEITLADGKKYPSKLVTIDEKNNLAILRIPNNSDLKPTRLPKNLKLSIGQFLILISHNRKEKSQNVITFISKMNFSDEIYPQSNYLTKESLLISSRARIKPVPGLLFNIRGELVGFSYLYFEDEIFTNKFAMANYILELESILNELDELKGEN